MQQGNNQALGSLGSLLYSGRLGDDRRAEAFPYLLNALQRYPDDLIAHYDIARCYAYGIGVEKNFMKAREHFMIILDAEPEKEWYIVSYADILKDRGSAECIEWYKKGSGLGSGICSYSLGKIFEEGMRPSIWKDYDKAVYYYQLALRQLSNNDDSFERETYYLAHNSLNILQAKHENGEI